MIHLLGKDLVASDAVNLLGFVSKITMSSFMFQQNCWILSMCPWWLEFQGEFALKPP